MDQAYRNSEGYPDPTAGAALSFGYRPLVYICSKYRGDVETNIRNAQLYSRYAVEQGYIPIAPHLLLPQFVDEETERSGDFYGKGTHDQVRRGVGVWK